MFSSDSEHSWWDSDSFDSDDANEFLQELECQERIKKLMLERHLKVSVAHKDKLMLDMQEFENTLDRIEQTMDDMIDYTNTKNEITLKMKRCATLANRNYNTINKANKKTVKAVEFKSVMSVLTNASFKVLQTFEDIVAKMNTK